MVWFVSSLIVLVIAAVGVIAYDSNRFVVREVTVESDKLTDSGSFIFISDLHSNRYGKNNRKLLKALEDLTPSCDGVLLAGDMFSAHKGEDFSEAVRVLKFLSSKLPVYYSMGNHETRARDNVKVYNSLYEDYMNSLKDTGIVFLDNESTAFKGITVTGLSLPKDYYRKRRLLPLSKETVTDLVGEKRDGFNILLAHDPEYFDSYAEYGADLVLSGHFHGGIVRLFGRGLISPRFTLFPKYSGGMYEKNNCRMLVNRGLGSHTIPWRMFNPAEIILLKLKPTIFG